MNVCIEVNLDNETSKSGILGDKVLQLAKDIENLPYLNLRGLMLIPAFHKEYSQQCAIFSRLRDLLTEINQKLKLNMDTLSMGMSNDFPAAINAGATIVRIGTSIFGEREKNSL